MIIECGSIQTINVCYVDITDTRPPLPGNAALMGIREDLGFSSAQFSLAVSMFFVGTAIADVFTNIGMRYIRPSLYLAGAMVCYVMSCYAFGLIEQYQSKHPLHTHTQRVPD